MCFHCLILYKIASANPVGHYNTLVWPAKFRWMLFAHILALAITKRSKRLLTVSRAMTSTASVPATNTVPSVTSC